jgi:hypothetical protein
MHKRLQLSDLIIKRSFLIIAAVLFILYGCAPSGLVIDLEQFETPVKNMYLGEYPYLKICHGGISQHIPLRQIQMVKINQSSSILFENELYYSAELIFRSGAKIQSPKDRTKQNPVYVSVENTLMGKSKEQKFAITLDNVRQIQIKK